MITIKLLDYKSMEKIRVRLDEPIVIEVTTRKNYKTKCKIIVPPEFKNYKNKTGVYIICKNNKVIYVGATTDLYNRIRNHKIFKSNLDVKHIYFLEVYNVSIIDALEIMYKYYYLGDGRLEFYQNSVNFIKNN